MSSAGTQVRVHPPESGLPTGPHLPRRDIQGLRALAVIAVVLDHAWGWPRGGFVGVDVFFVISGYLITDLMLRERARTGRISLPGFYRRRAKRILPVAVIVLAATVAAGFVVFSRPRWTSTITDAAWSAVFAANWRFGSVGVDYFDSDRPTSPLQHFWSLAVEEQFYVFWPTVIIVAVALLGGRRPGTRRAVLAGLALALTAASLGWAFVESARNPDLAYFSSFSRFWEIGVGALLAILAPVIPKLPRIAARALSWGGLGGILASYAVVSESAGFPAPWALLPVLSTAAVLVGGLHLRLAGPWPLTNGVSRYVGDMSYSLYLWHFPVIVLGTAVIGDGFASRTVLTVACLVVAFYSYELVEDPLRRAPWRAGLRSRLGRGAPDTTPASAGGDPRRRLVAFSLAATLAVVVLGSVAATGGGSPEEPVDLARPSQANFSELTPVEERWTPRVEEALQATSWPRLTPSAEDAIGSPQAPADVVRCGAAGSPLDVDDCTWGSESAPRTAVVIGDSVSLTYVAPLRDLLTRSGRWQVVSLGTFGCPFVDLPLGSSAASVKTCERRRTAAETAVRSLDPDVVLVSNSADTPPQFPSGDSVSERDWREGLESTLSSVSAPDRRTVLLAPPPGDVSLEECYSPLAEPSDCVSPVSEDWTDRATTERALMAEADGTWINSAPWFCTAQRCPSFVDGTPVRSDSVHMTLEYARKIEPLLGVALRPVGRGMARAVKGAGAAPSA